MLNFSKMFEPDLDNDNNDDSYNSHQFRSASRDLD